MDSHHVEIAAESYVVHLLSIAGYDVFVQYGPNQPGYDLTAFKKGKRPLKISVKGSQNGGWILAPKKKDFSYQKSIDRWFKKHDRDIIFAFVQFKSDAEIKDPRVYLGKVDSVYKFMKKQRFGKGSGVIFEKLRRRSKYSDFIPNSWIYSQQRTDALAGTSRGIYA